VTKRARARRKEGAAGGGARGGALTPEETEKLGDALMRLEETVRDLAARFDLTPEELNLDLGPLGRLR